MLLALACTRPPVARPDRLWGSHLARHHAGDRVDVLPGDDAPILVSAPYVIDGYGENEDGAGRVFRLSPDAPSGLLSDAADTLWVSPPAVQSWGDALFAGDLDGDGAQEILIDGHRTGWEDGVLATWYGLDQGGRLTTADARGELGAPAVSASLHLTTLGDVDGDGHDDLALMDGTGAGSAVWFGPFADDEPRTPDDATWVTGRSYRNDKGVAAVDLGGDGVRELVVAGDGPDGLHVVDPRARDLDVSGAPYVRVEQLSPLHVGGDLDGDGAPDVVYGGVFTDLEPGATPWWTLDEDLVGDAATGDFDGDGQDDLVQAVSHDGRYKAYLFRGPLPRGVATSADADVVIEAHDGPDGWPGLHFAAGDVDGDGRDDLVVGEPGDEESFAGGSVSLYLGRSLFP
jgi:hypothetical protein